MKRTFILQPIPHTSRGNAIQAIREAADGLVVTISEPTRNLSQNAAQWPILQAFAEQLQWPVNGSMCKLTPEEFKDILTAAFRRETVRVAMGLDGGMVMLGQKTREFTKAEFSEWLEFLHATAVIKSVNLSF
jgi:hypothetical protein